MKNNIENCLNIRRKKTQTNFCTDTKTELLYIQPYINRVYKHEKKSMENQALQKRCDP